MNQGSTLPTVPMGSPFQLVSGHVPAREGDKLSNTALPACISPVATYLFPESSFIILHHCVGANMDSLHLTCYKLALQVHM